MVLRKMLGSVDHPQIVRLMRLIETQSKNTLAVFTAEYVAAHYLPIAQDEILSAAVEAVRAHLKGELPLKELKPLLKAARTAAQEEKYPARQAAKRAIATAVATIVTPTNSLGFAFYGAAAYAYHTTTDAALHDDLATEELTRIADALQAASIPDEPNPVQVDWGC